jgi:hypothetical protein
MHNEDDENFFHKAFEVTMLMSHLHEKDTKWYLDFEATSHGMGDVGKFTKIRKVVDITKLSAMVVTPIKCMPRALLLLLIKMK